MDWTTALIAAASEARLRSGFGGATTSYPEVTSSRLMPAKPDASANAPWTRTTVGLGESVMRSLLVTRLSPTLARRAAAGLSPVQVIAAAPTRGLAGPMASEQVLTVEVRRHVIVSDRPFPDVMAAIWTGI